MRIIFTPVQAGKPWNGATIYQEPLGGSESAVVYLARALARKGHTVTVVTHGMPAVFDGVNYVTNEALGSLMSQRHDVIVSSRWLEILKYQWQVGARVFWSHDMPHVSGLIPADRGVFLTEFHAQSWGISEPNWVRIIGNGVDMSLFIGPDVERDPNKLVWTSNPDRGLPIATKIFQEIRQSWPDLELHVYGRSSVYGWGPETEAPYLPRPQHMENVFIHEALNKAALAIALREAWAWFYPTYWPETYCIAALEAQAAGTPCVSVPFGGLNETVQGGVLQYDFKNAISQLRNSSKWQKESQAGFEFARTRDYGIVADEWLAVFEEVLNGQPKPVVA